MKLKIYLIIMCVLLYVNVYALKNGIYSDKYKCLYLVVCGYELVYINYFKAQDLNSLHAIARGKINFDSCYVECYKHKECNLEANSPLYALTPFCYNVLMSGTKIHYIERFGKIKKVEILYRLGTEGRYIKVKKVNSVSDTIIKRWINEVMDTTYYDHKIECIIP